MSVRATAVAEFIHIKNAPRECSLDDYRLMSEAEWMVRYRRGYSAHYQVQLYHLVKRSHRSYVQNGKESPWNFDLTVKPVEVKAEIAMPIGPNTLPAPDELTTIPAIITGPVAIDLAKQVLGFFYEGKPVPVHVIIRKMATHGVEEVRVRNVVGQLKKGGVLLNPDKGVYEKVPNAD